MLSYLIISGKVTKIETKNSRICVVLYTCDCSTTLMINCYMPCDNYTVDENYVDTLNTISQLLYSYNPSHVVIGGDMNVDFNRSSPHTRILTDFIEDFNLYSCGDLPIASVPYTYTSSTNITSKIDHFIVSESLHNIISESSIIDNHLYSDHVLLYLKFYIDVIHVPEQKQPFTVKQAWHKASKQDVNMYETRLDVNMVKQNCCS